MNIWYLYNNWDLESNYILMMKLIFEGNMSKYFLTMILINEYSDQQSQDISLSMFWCQIIKFGSFWTSIGSGFAYLEPPKLFEQAQSD